MRNWYSRRSKRFGVAALVTASALLVTGHVGAEAVQAGSLQLRFSRAERIFRGGDFETALPLLDRVITALEQRAGDESDQVRLLLRRSLTYRVIARWNTGQRERMNAQLDRIVELDPAFVLEAEAAPEALADRYVQRRERKVGFLRIATFPVDARVFVNGEEIDPVPDLLPVLAGEHEVYADKPGFAFAEEIVSVRANRTQGVGLELERSSATIQIATQPYGATVVVDGDVIGRTLAEADREGGAVTPSKPIVVEGLLPGWHELEVTLANYRPFRQRVEIPDLADYDLGLLRMERSVGIVVLRGLPRDARVLVDGDLYETEWQSGLAVSSRPGAGSGRVTLAVGDHTLSVTHGDAGVFETGVVVEDGATISFDVDLRPGLLFLGVIGGDLLDRDAVRDALRRPLGGLDNWFVLDRADDEESLPPLGLTAAEIGGTEPAAVRSGVDWEGVRQRATDAVPAGLLALVTIAETSLPGAFDLWLWPSAPGLAEPLRLRLSVDDEAGLARVAERIENPLPGSTSWVGATWVDSQLTGQPTVIAVQAGGPAAMAGLRPGDEIVSIDGVEVATVWQVVEAVQATAPFAALTIQYRRAGAVSVVPVTLGSSPRVVSQGAIRQLGPVIWAAVTAEIARGGSTTPAWVMRLDQVLILMEHGEWTRAERILRGMSAPEDVPFGRAAVDYWHGVTLSSLPIPDRAAARVAFERAAARRGARLYHHDGPLVAPRARARLALLDSAAS